MENSENTSLSGSTGTFLEEDFQLPDLEINSNCNLEALRDEKRQQQRINVLKSSLSKEKRLSCAVDKLPAIPNSYFIQKYGTKRPEKLVMHRTTHTATTEMNAIKSSLERKPGEPRELLEILESIHEGRFEGEGEDDDEDNYKESTIEHPKLGSVEEKLEDFRQSSIEDWCARHGKAPKQKYTNNEKRMLRKWFRALDYDGSGEVSVEELQDPMLSSGILKTREQVVRVLANVDKNNTMGIDFEEFLLALSANKLADDSKLKKLQYMSANPYFQTDTLLTAERRNKLLKSILQRCEERQTTIDNLYKKYDKTKLSKRERELFDIEREKLEEDQSRSIYLHLKYIHALELVIHDREDFYSQQEEQEMEENKNKNQFKDEKEFNQQISLIRANCSNRQEAMNTLQSILPVTSSSNPSNLLSTLSGGNGKESSSNVRTSLSLGTITKPLKRNSVEEFRMNPSKIYSPYSPPPSLNSKPVLKTKIN